MQQIEVLPWFGCHEPFSAISHLIGAAVFAGFTPFLIQQGRDNLIRATSLSIFAIASAQLLATSGLYHVFGPGAMRKIMFRLDVASVFVLIAASMTPSHAILFQGWGRWGALALIWLTAIVGITVRISYWAATSGTTAIAFFLLFGWASVFGAMDLWRRFGWSFIKPAIMSGLCYTVGAIILINHRMNLVPGVIGPHEIWHVAVLAGIALQWLFVRQFASGQFPMGFDSVDDRKFLSSPTVIVLETDDRLTEIQARGVISD